MGRRHDHQVIPKAISFFDGSINRQQPDFDSDEFDEEDDDDDDDEEDSDDEDGPRTGRKAPAPPSGNTPASHQDPQE